MPFPRATLPCSVCGAGIQLRPPELPATVRGFLQPIVKLASLHYGEPLAIPPSGNIFELFNGQQLAQLLELRCPGCAIVDVDANALVTVHGR